MTEKNGDTLNRLFEGRTQEQIDEERESLSKAVIRAAFSHQIVPPDFSHLEPVDDSNDAIAVTDTTPKSLATLLRPNEFEHDVQYDEWRRQVCEVFQEEGDGTKLNFLVDRILRDSYEGDEDPSGCAELFLSFMRLIYGEDEC